MDLITLQKINIVCNLLNQIAFQEIKDFILVAPSFDTDKMEVIIEVITKKNKHKEAMEEVVAKFRKLMPGIEFEPELFCENEEDQIVGKIRIKNA